MSCFGFVGLTELKILHCFEILGSGVCKAWASAVSSLAALGVEKLFLLTPSGSLRQFFPASEAVPNLLSRKAGFAFGAMSFLEGVGVAGLGLGFGFGVCCQMWVEVLGIWGLGSDFFEDGAQWFQGFPGFCWVFREVFCVF